MGIPRRQFLKRLWQSWQVGALGLVGALANPFKGIGSQNAWAASVNQQGTSRAITKSISRFRGRKLAVLVGINNYDNFPLRGCVTDVALQKQLLIHRFGFAATDIVILTDEAATTSNITQAVTEHLIAQALPEDLVVWHFSGCGTRCDGKDALVPADELDLISLELVQHWLKSITAHQVLGVIDAGFYYPEHDLAANLVGNSLVANTAIRARPCQSQMRLIIPNSTPALTELTTSATSSTNTQANLGTNIHSVNAVGRSSNLDRSQVGLIMAATGEQLCLDINPAGFGCGAFTYALTQSLWDSTAPMTDWQLERDLAYRLLNSSDSLPQIQWLDETRLNNPDAVKLLPLLPQGDPASGGVILDDPKSRNVFDLWLIGVPPHALADYQSGSILRMMKSGQGIIFGNQIGGNQTGGNQTGVKTSITGANPTGNSQEPDLEDSYWLGLQSRQGLLGKVELLPTEPDLSQILPSITKIGSGDLVQEQIRVMPRQVALYVALDNSLNKIERIDATSALSAQPNLGPLLQPLNHGADHPPDCIFSLQSISYGILSLSREPLAGSFGAVGESVGVAIKRLSASFAELLAAKLLRLTENAAGSGISVQASLYNLGAGLKSEATKSLKSAPSRDLISTCSTQKFSNSASGEPAEKPLINQQIPKNQTQVLSASPNPSGSNRPSAAVVNPHPQQVNQINPVDLGDRLECHINNGEDTPLYVELFYIDSRGRLLNRIGTNQIPSQSYAIPAHQTLVIPPAPFSWSVTAPKGPVEAIVIVSRHPFINYRAVLTNESPATNPSNGALGSALTNTIYTLRLAESILLDLHQQSLEHQGHLPDNILKTINAYLPNDDHHWIWDMYQWATLRLNYYVA